MKQKRIICPLHSKTCVNYIRAGHLSVRVYRPLISSIALCSPSLALPGAWDDACFQTILTTADDFRRAPFCRTMKEPPPSVMRGRALCKYRGGGD
ncbi:hypothetical protein JTE90_001783 [Oedothorax gibbosus]|uniref:Uncharacterized protein n=1 Tax=Oedothorax gibbosus TaxID=931172 RepID=A0AAV6VSA9_9ARAC|nr:hypothetical protein JTE90_001783 [Oedothorax gibbosus]